MKRLLYAFYYIFFLSLCVKADDVVTFSAEKMSGSSGKKDSITILEGSAKVSIGSLVIESPVIELSGEDYRFVSARGGIKGSDTQNGFSFSAEQLEYDRDTEVAVFRGNARLDDFKNEVVATAGYISYNRKTEVALLQIAVGIKRKNIECTAGFALYRRVLSTLDLSGSPVVKRKGDDFRADRITVTLETEHIILDGTVSGTLNEGAPSKTAQPGQTEDPANPSETANPANLSPAPTGIPLITPTPPPLIETAKKEEKKETTEDDVEEEELNE